MSELFELLIALLSVLICDADLKDEISDMLVSFDGMILLEMWCMVDSMTADDLFCKIEMDALIFQNNHE